MSRNKFFLSLECEARIYNVFSPQEVYHFAIIMLSLILRMLRKVG